MLILTETKEEYEKAIKIAERENISKHLVYKPEDSIARVVWSIEDVRGMFPEKTPDKEIFQALQHIEDGIQSTTTAACWEAIETLKYEMINQINEKEDVK